MTINPAPSADEAAGKLAEQVFGGIKATLEIFTIHVGVRLGLYQAFTTGQPQTADTLARAAAVHPRYAREWLEQQASLGILAIDADDADPYRRSFRLPEGHAAVLADEESPYYLGGGALFCAGVGDVLGQVIEAFRTGKGVPYSAYGADVRHGIAHLNHPQFTHARTEDWFLALPDLRSRLEAGQALRVLDLGCGTGSSSVALARRYPAVRVTGVDLDPASVEEAKVRAKHAAVDDRVDFVVANAAAFQTDDPYDLVIIFEALHDMADPVGALIAARRVLASGGVLLVADEQVGEQFTAPGSFVEQFNYAASVVHCLPATRAEGSKAMAITDTVVIGAGHWRPLPRRHRRALSGRVAGWAGQSAPQRLFVAAALAAAAYGNATDVVSVTASRRRSHGKGMGRPDRHMGLNTTGSQHHDPRTVGQHRRAPMNVSELGTIRGRASPPPRALLSHY